MMHTPRPPRRDVSCEKYLHRLARFGMKPGLERIIALLGSCGNPQRSFTCVHVAGTNGKGSVCAIAESILRAAGLRTGLYTSPHLVSYRERIRVEGEEIGEEMADRCAAALIPAAEKLAVSPGGSPTYFEFMTAVALSAFAQSGVECAVVETGLGGRLDATNVLDAPVVVIAGIGLEHRAQLGDTVAAIAGEKAAIIASGAYVVCAEMERAARDAVMERSRENMATVATIGGDILYEISRQSPEGIALRVRGTRDSYGGLFLPLLGRHQAANCAAAIGAIEGLRSIGLEISPQAVREGVASVRWPGRMELLGRDPLFLVDCAHNPSAARAVAGGVGEIFPRLRWVLILGVLGDKDIEGICEALLPLASDIVTTRVRSERSAEPGRIASVCRGRTRAGVYEAKGLREALGLARTIVTDGRAEGIFLTGSTYLVGEALALAGRPLPLFP